MEKVWYITDDERAKCQKVAEAFTELYEMESIVVLDAERYGFVMLKYYSPDKGFDESDTFTDNKSLFDALWEEWLNTKCILWQKALRFWRMAIRACLIAFQTKNRRHLSGEKTILH